VKPSLIASLWSRSGRELAQYSLSASLAHLAHQAGFKKKEAHTGAVTLIQRFGSALNLNIHFHMLFLDGVYIDDGAGHFAFHSNKAPTAELLTEVLHTISQRIADFLERRGLLE
jgi:hypothetical protein